MSINYYYFTDFEDGIYGNIYLASGTYSLSGAKYRDGSTSLLCNPTGVNTGYMGFAKTLSASTGTRDAFNVADLYIKFDFLYDTKPSSGSEEFCVFSSSGAKKMSVRLNSSGQIEVYNAFDVLVDTGSTVLNSNTWYLMEMYCGTGSSASWEVKIDGVTEIHGSTDNLSTINHYFVYLGKYSNQSNEDVEYYFDNFVAADWWVRDAYVTMHNPNADGTTHEWHSGTGTDYQEVDEAVIDGTLTELVSTAAIGELHQVAFPACGETEDILAVMAQAICRNYLYPDLILQTVVGTTTDETTGDSSTDVVYTSSGSCSWRKIWSISFDTGIAWTAAELDGIQVGIKTAGTAAAGRCSQLCYKVLLDRGVAPSVSASPSSSPSVSPSPSESPSDSPSSSPSPPIDDKLELIKTEEIAFNRTAVVEHGWNAIDFLRDRFLAPGDSDNYDITATFTYNAGNINSVTVAGGDGDGEAGLELKVHIFGLAI